MGLEMPAGMLMQAGFLLWVVGEFQQEQVGGIQASDSVQGRE